MLLLLEDLLAIGLLCLLVFYAIIYIGGII